MQTDHEEKKERPEDERKIRRNIKRNMERRGEEWRGERTSSNLSMKAVIS
jgi:hypothetical protein